VTVVLTGDGGDELFAGYMRFYAGLLSERIPRVLGTAASALLSAVPTPGHERHWFARAQRFAGPMGRPLDERMTSWNALFDADLRQLLRRDLVDSLAPIDPLKHMAAERESIEGRSTLARLLHVNFASYLADDLLVKTDRCTMANSLEARCPFLDRELVEYAATLPDDLKLRGRQTKFILRHAFRDLLPQGIATRGKMGFGVPVGAWFRGALRPYVTELLLAPDARYRELLDSPFVEGLVERHLSARANLGPQIWSLVCFERWLRLLPDWTRGSVLVKQPDLANLDA
jgi:asparagine synthase (glutamine-hydrolysing)